MAGAYCSVCTYSSSNQQTVCTQMTCNQVSTQMGSSDYFDVDGDMSTGCESSYDCSLVDANSGFKDAGK